MILQAALARLAFITLRRAKEMGELRMHKPLQQEQSPDGNDEFHRDYVTIQYHLVQFLSEHLSDCSRAFDGDLQQMLVLAVVGQAKLNAAKAKPEDCKNHRSSITASRIADITGIPRQTVRRKLSLLEERAWLEKLDDQSWQIRMIENRSPARRELEALDRRSFVRFSRLINNLKHHF